MSSLGFMTVALGPKYEQFVGPYIVSTLTTYPEATCEIRVLNPAKWKAANKKLLTTMKRVLGDRFQIAGVGFPWKRRGLLPNTVRFVISPLFRRPDILYIGDVDIIVSATGILEFHEDAMDKLGLPYSNVIRPGKQRLTGLHVIRTEDYYRKITPDARQAALGKWGKGNDEVYLYHLCRTNLGLPKERMKRPVYGVHASPQRPLHTDDGCHWGVKSHLQTHLKLVQSDEWAAVFPLFASEFRQKMVRVVKWIEKNAGNG